MLPSGSLKELKKTIDETSANTGLLLTLALSYSSRWEIVETMRSIARKIESRELSPEDIDYKVINSYLSTHGIPDPELLIRTSGEFRISNFLLWQIAYAELYFTQTLWPDFDKTEFFRAILDYQQRERRFGMTSEQINEFESKKRK
jgi:undecaprenyl diphosphate synthase